MVAESALVLRTFCIRKYEAHPKVHLLTAQEMKVAITEPSSHQVHSQCA